MAICGHQHPTRLHIPKIVSWYPIKVESTRKSGLFFKFHLDINCNHQANSRVCYLAGSNCITMARVVTIMRLTIEYRECQCNLPAQNHMLCPLTSCFRGSSSKIVLVMCPSKTLYLNTIFFIHCCPPFCSQHHSCLASFYPQLVCNNGQIFIATSTIYDFGSILYGFYVARFASIIHVLCIVCMGYFASEHKLDVFARGKNS